MVAAFLADARPASVADGRVVVAFPAGAGFAKKKVEANRGLVRDAFTQVLGSTPAIEYDVGAEPAEESAPADAPLSEEELLARLKEDFNAREVFDDDAEA